MSEIATARLQAPESRLSSLSFAQASPSAIAEWVSGLPLANISETATQLELASTELAQLASAGPVKYECLESLRPVIHYVCSRLDRRASKDSGKNTSATTLLLNLCNGYKAVVVDLIPSQEGVKHKGGLRDALAKSMHRLLSDLSRVLLRAMQNYSSPPTNFWFELHEAYRLSELLELQNFAQIDSENHGSTSISIQNAYVRSLLLATCKSNQLQKSQINKTFSALELWADNVVINKDTRDSLYVIDLLGNGPPRYTKQVRNLKDPRALRIEVVAYEIEAFLNGLNSSMPIPDNIEHDLLRHLISTWSSMTTRSFKRLATDTPLRLCVGLRAAHYFLSGGVDFGDQIANTATLLRREVNPFLDVSYESTTKDEDDPWSQAHDLKVKIPENPNIETPESILLAQSQNRSKATYEHFEALAQDTSPAGYQVTWKESNQQPQVGDLIAIREEKDSRWCIAAVRWLAHDRGEIRTGVELLAPKAIPVALRIIQKVGGPTDYVRGLLLPEVPAIKQAATLITPSVPFAAGNKVNVHRQGLQSTAQLLDCLQKTETFNQFTFRMLDGYLES
ncbi:MAG: hypothetical protein AAF541_20055 [Pseudomonadota bacterium]